MKEKMRNTIRRVLSVFAALVMVLGVMGANVTPVMADDPTYSIQITNAKPGETYNVYKMFSINSSTGTGNDITYNYTVVDAWKNFFASGGAGNSYVTLDDLGQVTKIAFTGDESQHATNVKEFAQKALKYANDNNISPNGTGTVAPGATTVTISNLQPGYYLVDTTMGSLCMLDNVDGSETVEIAEKNETPTVEKVILTDNNEVKKNTASIGDSISFKSTIKIPSKGGESTTNLKLHDKLDRGFTLNTTSIAVAYNDQNWANGTQYNLVTTNLDDGCSFEISFVDSYIQSLPANAQIVVTYTATVNSDANIGGTKDSEGEADSINRDDETTGKRESPYKGNINDTWVGYGGSSTTEHSSTETDVWSFDLLKRGASHSDALGGAEFQIYNTATSGSAIKFEKIDDTTRNENAVNRAFNNYRRSTENNSTDTIVATTGFLTISGLKAGTYYLDEIKAPEGYNKLTSRVGFTINENGTLNILQSQDESAHQSIVVVNGSEISNSTGGVQIVNEKGSILPSTGGIGTTIFYVIGSVIIAGAIVLLIARRKRNA